MNYQKMVSGSVLKLDFSMAATLKQLHSTSLDDEEAGGLSIEAGYEKDGKYAKIKYEKDEIDPNEDVTVFDEDDEEAGGFSIEAGYEKDGKYAKIKYEKGRN